MSMHGEIEGIDTHPTLGQTTPRTFLEVGPGRLLAYASHQRAN